MNRLGKHHFSPMTWQDYLSCSSGKILLRGNSQNNCRRQDPESSAAGVLVKGPG
jgi:hypothetical protein